jgi:hypothetical protein
VFVKENPQHVPWAAAPGSVLPAAPGSRHGRVQSMTAAGFGSDSAAPSNVSSPISTLGATGGVAVAVSGYAVVELDEHVASTL